jgi:hypothetical protein
MYKLQGYSPIDDVVKEYGIKRIKFVKDTNYEEILEPEVLYVVGNIAYLISERGEIKIGLCKFKS